MSTCVSSGGSLVVFSAWRDEAGGLSFAEAVGSAASRAGHERGTLGALEVILWVFA